MSTFPPTNCILNIERQISARRRPTGPRLSCFRAESSGSSECSVGKELQAGAWRVGVRVTIHGGCRLHGYHVLQTLGRLPHSPTTFGSRNSAAAFCACKSGILSRKGGGYPALRHGGRRTSAFTARLVDLSPLHLPQAWYLISQRTVLVSPTQNATSPSIPTPLPARPPHPRALTTNPSAKPAGLLGKSRAEHSKRFSKCKWQQRRKLATRKNGPQACRWACQIGNQLTWGSTNPNQLGARTKQSFVN